MRPFKIYSVLIFALAAACVDPFNTSIDGQKKLVVDALMTDQPGPHTVRLSYSTKLGVNSYKTEKIDNAQVSIVDSDGITTALGRTESGVYQTLNPSFKAEVGKSYSLKIRIGSNAYYESDIEAYENPGQFDQLYFEYDGNATPPRFLIYSNATKAAGSNGLMRWRWNATYKYHTYPELYISDGAIRPWPCSGFLTNPHTPCICCDCYASEQSVQITIYDGAQSAGTKYDKILVGTYQVLPDRFEDKSYIEVEQMSLTPQIYNFWKLVVTQQQGATSLFQPAAVRVKGNIHSISNANEEVLGIFGVSFVIKKSVFINRADIPKASQPVNEYKTNDCRVYYPVTTTTRPPFW